MDLHTTRLARQAATTATWSSILLFALFLFTLLVPGKTVSAAEATGQEASLAQGESNSPGKLIP